MTTAVMVITRESYQLYIALR